MRNELYLPLSQVPDPLMKGIAAYSTFVVRTAADPLATVSAVRCAVLNGANDQPVNGARSMNEIVLASIADRRFSLLLLGTFASLALLLADVGIYGVILIR